MAKWPEWRHILEGAKHEAIEAVDHYNRPMGKRGLEGFYVHMHMAWLYLLQAEFRRDKVDFRYRQKNGHFERVDGGEIKCWELARCVKERFPDNSPVRKNLELTIRLRNRLEHRAARSTQLVTAGYAQSLLLNFEDELVEKFGTIQSLADSLRFPVYVANLVPMSGDHLERVLRSVPKATATLIAKFEAGLEPTVREDQRYEFRVLLTPMQGSKTNAELAITFVREDELTPAERRTLAGLGKKGTVVVRERLRPVAHLDDMKPSVVAQQVQERLPFQFSVYSHFPAAWKKLKVRPPSGDAHPERTDEKYCVYDAAHRDYLYTVAFIDKLVRELSTEEKFRAFFGKAPLRKVSPISGSSSAAG